MLTTSTRFAVSLLMLTGQLHQSTAAQIRTTAGLRTRAGHFTPSRLRRKPYAQFSLQAEFERLTLLPRPIRERVQQAEHRDGRDDKIEVKLLPRDEKE
jgi:hypothetical protein